MGNISLDYAAPAEELRDYLSVFYEFRADVPEFEDLERADLAQIRFMLTGDGEMTFADGNVQQAFAITIVGPTTGMTKVTARGPLRIFGVGLLPAGWGALMGIEASSMVNRLVDGTEIFGKGLLDVAERMRGANSLDSLVEIGNALIRDLATHAKDKPFQFTRIVDNWLASDFSPDVEDLVIATGLSRRQVERNCKRLYGAPPKVLARKYRALKAAIHLAKGEADLHDLVVEGFYDQSHFIREIKHFTGVTPKRIRDDLPTLAKLTLKRGELAGEVAPIIYET